MAGLCYPLGTGLAFSDLSIEENLFGSTPYLALQDPRLSCLEPPIPIGAGRLCCFRMGQVLSCQYKAPFAQGHLASVDTSGLAGALQLAMARASVQEAVIQLPPMVPGLASWHVRADERSPFKAAASAYNYHLPVSPQPFGNSLPADQRRVLRRQHEAGWVTTIATAAQLPLVYQILAANRAQRGYAMPLALNELQAASMAMPNDYLAYLAKDGAGMMVGAAVVVRVNSLVWYTFLLGHIPSGPGTSPILSLLAQIWADAQRAGATILDLGTAGLPGHEHAGLAAFKRSLGALRTVKITLRLARN